MVGSYGTSYQYGTFTDIPCCTLYRTLHCTSPCIRTKPYHTEVRAQTTMGGMKQAMTNCTRKGGVQPTVAGKAAARAGRSAGYRAHQMPICNYGAACTRRDCVYRHPQNGSSEHSDEVCRPFLAYACQYGDKCYNRHPDEAEAERLRAHYAGIPCRWGLDCRTSHCLFNHETVAEKPQNGLRKMGTIANSLPSVSGKGCIPCEPQELKHPSEGLQPSDELSRNQPSHIPSSHGEKWTQWSNSADRPLNALATEWLPSAAASAAAPTAATGESAVYGLWGGSHDLSESRLSFWMPPLADEVAQPHGPSIWSEVSSGYKPAAGSWAAVAVAPPRAAPQPAAASELSSYRPAGGRLAEERSVNVPAGVWLLDVARVDAATAFNIQDPLERFRQVNWPHDLRLSKSPVPLILPLRESRGTTGSHYPAAGAAKVLDLHYQSVRTAPLVLDAELPDALAAHAEVWIVTGTGHHTAAASHQRSVVGGVLHATVKEYLQENGYDFYVGRDNAGHSGAFLVRA